METEKLKIDMAMFIKCRLCLNETGEYLISKIMQDQIKECFGIVINKYDGLSQIICQDCDNLLNKYESIKKTFQDNQMKLKSDPNEDAKMVTDKVALPLQDAISITQQCVGDKSYNCDESKQDNEIKTKNVLQNDWMSNFMKNYVCKFCSESYENKKEVTTHINEMHRKLLSKHNNILSTHCFVLLQKDKHKENLTGSKHMVAYNRRKILKNKTAYYYISYTAKRLHSTNHSDSSSSNDDFDINRRRRKRMRLSSTDTVVMDDPVTNNGVSNTTNSESTLVVDDSDSSIASCKVSDDVLEDQSKNIHDYVKNQISQCKIKHINKLRNGSQIKTKLKVVNESQIQHKLLSIGCKVINKVGFSCTGLLRYLEYKNLDVNFTPSKEISKDSVHIQTIKRAGKENDNEQNAWHNVFESLDIYNKLNFTDVLKNAKKKIAETLDVTHPKSCFKDPTVHTVSNEGDASKDNSNSENLKTLLNENPVSNPKKLPKKSILLETKTNIVETCSISMPVLPIGESLGTINTPAESSQENNQVNSLNNTVNNETVAVNNNKTYLPRIKVKPDSVLLKASLPNQYLSYPSHTLRKSEGYPIPTFLRKPTDISNMPNYNGFAVRPFEEEFCNFYRYSKKVPILPSENNFLLLDTTEIPRFKTNSPFTYFQNLLHFHKIILFESNREIVPNLVRLIKFKLVLTQKNLNPITLTAELYSDAQNFCIHIKNENSVLIDIKGLSANWQWEILEIFSSDVTTEKTLNHAQGISQQMYDRTSYFVFLLKSIRKLS